MKEHIEIFKSKGSLKRWYFHVKAGNGKITNASEGYYSKWNAKRAAKRSFPHIPIG
jgi:uncharacterized protein YegP (UPF0339 family)